MVADSLSIVEVNIDGIDEMVMGNRKAKFSHHGVKQKGKWTVDGIPATVKRHLRLTFDHFLPVFGTRGEPPKDSKVFHQALDEIVASRFRSNHLEDRFVDILYVGPVRERIPHYGILGTMPQTELGPSGQNLMGIAQSVAEAIDLLPRVVEGQGRPRRGRDLEELHHGHGAVVAGTHREAKRMMLVK